ncbi:MAG TPA: nucleoside deaminase [Drouetiella sp.]
MTAAVKHTPDEMKKFLAEAINEARKGLSEGGIPIGSVLVRNGEIIGRGHNRRVQNNNPTAHAEIECLKNAGRLNTYADTVLYSTLMPCAMCAGASVQFRIPLVVAGENKTFKSASDWMESMGTQVVDLDSDECYRMLQEFAKAHPDIWDEDIGIPTDK